MSYDYDAFFSYKRDPETDAWHLRVKDKLAFWLRQELNQDEVKIFFDDEDIRVGTRFGVRIAESLRRSKCLICVWSPLYFRSRWCVSEWLSFVQRERDFGGELIIPASFHDGETFPENAKAVQMKNFSDYTSTMPRFWDTDLAVEFEKKLIRPFARDLAAKIRGAPPFNPTFPVVTAPDIEVQGELPIGRIADV